MKRPSYPVRSSVCAVHSSNFHAPNYFEGAREPLKRGPRPNAFPGWEGSGDETSCDSGMQLAAKFIATGGFTSTLRVPSE